MDDSIELLAYALEKNASFEEKVFLVQQVVDSILSGKIISQSSWHPYGFLQIRLPGDRLWKEEKKTVKLHIWPSRTRTRQTPDWPIHNHAYNLYSTILAGKVYNELYRIQQTPKHSSNNILYVARYEGEFSYLDATDLTVCYEKSSENEYRIGEIYAVPIDYYHIANVPTETFASTTVLAADWYNSAQYVVGEINHESTYQYRRTLCKTEELEFLLTRLRSEIEKLI